MLKLTSYFKNLNPRDSKKFWKALKYLNKQQSTIHILQHGEQTTSTDLQKAELLNTFFSASFKKSHPPHTAFSPVPHPNMIPPLTKCTVPSLKLSTCYKDLKSLKPVGPDKISAQMLKYTASSIAPSVTKLFNLSIRLGRIPDCWKEAMIAPIPKSTSKSSDP